MFNVAPQQPQPPPPPQPGAAQPRSRWRRWGCVGCLAFGGLLSCCVLATVFFGPGIWGRLGLFRTSAEDLYSGASDPYASQIVTQILIEAGVPGARAVVVPIKGSDGQIAVITLDSSAGFDGTGTASGNEMVLMDVLQRMREDNRMEMLGIERVSVDYRDKNGGNLLAITVSQESLEAFSQGQLTRKELLQKVDVGLPTLDLQEMLALLAEGS
ncbi:MAG TPA: hypothetical protein VI520_02635 [Anaerolineales bacterium]|nr:hypothetical protein [Anaerolineales bacterium]